MWNNFKKDFIKQYSEKDFEEIEQLMEKMWDTDDDRFDQRFTEWDLSLEKEKHNELQYTYYIHLSKEGDDHDEEVNLEFENGINNGTLMVDYSLDGGGGIPHSRTQSVLKEVKLTDWSNFDVPKDMTVGEFKNLPNTLLDIYKKRGYDNYVTGSRIHKPYMNDFTKNLIDRGLQWEVVYEDIEVDILV